MADGPARRSRWPALFAESTRPLAVLSRARRVRFVNAAFETLAGRPAAELLGAACVSNGPTEPLHRTLAVPLAAARGNVTTVRRAAPKHAHGPPWWDLTYVPLTDADGVSGFLVQVRLVPADPAPAPRKLPPGVAALRAAHAGDFSLDRFAGTGAAAGALAAKLDFAASCSANVWITGEPGTGKETLARCLHHGGGPRDAGFATIDCESLQPYLLDAILLGRGGLLQPGRVGTLYLKEPAKLTVELQQHLLAGPLPRVVCGSRSGPLQPGLLPEFAARCGIFELPLPPLRERLHDLPRFTPHPLGADVLAVLRAHHWPGNFRELHAALAAARAKAEPIAAENLPRYLRVKALIAADPRPALPAPTLDEILERVERRVIGAALDRAKGNQTDAAAALGVFRSRLLRRLEALKIRP